MSKNTAHTLKFIGVGGIEKRFFHPTLSLPKLSIEPKPIGRKGSFSLIWVKGNFSSYG